MSVSSAGMQMRLVNQDRLDQAAQAQEASAATPGTTSAVPAVGQAAAGAASTQTNPLAQSLASAGTQATAGQTTTTQTAPNADGTLTTTQTSTKKEEPYEPPVLRVAGRPTVHSMSQAYLHAAADPSLNATTREALLKQHQELFNAEKSMIDAMMSTLFS